MKYKPRLTKYKPRLTWYKYSRRFSSQDILALTDEENLLLHPCSPADESASSAASVLMRCRWGKSHSKKQPIGIPGRTNWLSNKEHVLNIVLMFLITVSEEENSSHFSGNVRVYKNEDSVVESDMQVLEFPTMLRSSYFLQEKGTVSCPPGLKCEPLRQLGWLSDYRTILFTIMFS
ncbi:hypothetical protein NPIL_193771 [Nephila pilipes]|uniref:Uncharacterized protein n=1 Tax=Nephila pilipes TaxID=299642 RepID=A0A8X6UGV1_NEPPI|nr:hypothetical protein NPIL_193771 [Nephila pilipes]